MKEVVELITNNTIGVFCVAYLIYFQSTTMQKILEALNNMNSRLSVIEDKLDIDE